MTINLILMAAGAYFLWYGVANFGAKRGPINPGAPLRSLFQGKGLTIG